MTLGFLHSVSCNQPENSSFVQNFEDDKKVVQRSEDYKYDKKHFGLIQVPTDIPPKAKEVLLYFNDINEIPYGAFSHLTQCTFLSLQNNKLTHLASGMFDGLQALQVLVLSSNYIGDIKTGTFLLLTSCTWLSLKENRLIAIRSHMFFGLLSLKKLVLSQNIIFNIDPGSFLNLIKLSTLLLSKNYLTTLDRKVFHSLNLTSLFMKINGNPLLCDSRLCWIKQGEREEWLLIHNMDINGMELYKPQCVNYPGVDWDDISLTCPVVGKQHTRLLEIKGNYFVYLILIHSTALSIMHGTDIPYRTSTPL